MAGFPTIPDPALGGVAASQNSIDSQALIRAMGATAQLWAGPTMQSGNTSVGNSSLVQQPGNPDPMDAAGRPGYLGAGQPGGAPQTVIVPVSDNGATNVGANIILVGIPAGTAGGGGTYPAASLNPVPNPMIAFAWTNQQTDITITEYEITILNASPLPGSTHAVAMTTVNFTQTGAQGAVTWSCPQGVPDGVALSAGGAMTGTPTAAGTFTFQVRATDAEGNTGDKWFTWVVA